MPWEDEKKFFGLTERRGKLILIKQRTCGTCVFLSQNKCSIYDRRPFECQIYPFTLDFSEGVKLVIDPRAACAQFISEVHGRDLLKTIASKEFTHDWVRAFMYFAIHARPHLQKGEGHGEAQV